MNYFQLLQHLEDRLGYHQLPLNPGATNLRDLFDGTPLHHDWMMRFVRAIYAENRCQRLTDPVTPAETFKALAVLRQQALKASATDVDLRTLVEEVGETVNAVFADWTQAKDAGQGWPDDAFADNVTATSSSTAPTGGSAEIIPFRGRRRRA